MSDPPPAPDNDPLVFNPVPVTARRDGWTAERQRAFIEVLASHGSVGAAARAVGMTPQTARRLRTRPQAEGFARAWHVAAEEGRLRAIDLTTSQGSKAPHPSPPARKVNFSLSLAQLPHRSLRGDSAPSPRSVSPAA